MKALGLEIGLGALEYSRPGLAPHSHQALTRLRTLAQTSGRRLTEGLSVPTIRGFLAEDPSLSAAIADALARAHEIDAQHPGLRWMDEDDLCRWAQGSLLSFYASDATSPYVPLAARGPWIVTTHGAVLHDSGGYGMLGLGHAPESIIGALDEPAVMANVMTPSLAQRRFTERLERAIGKNGPCPYARFACLNSGSEAVSLAGRICDINAFEQTRPGAAHQGERVRMLSLRGSFHGRTEGPARRSHATSAVYRTHLASFKGEDPLLVVPPNDVRVLEAAFVFAADSGVFFESLFLEPVLGEGAPGLAIERDFYDAARELTAAHGALLVVDSVQAGLRAQGVLSIVDYPGFEGCAPPDIETFSKALNAGQYPLSVIAMTEAAAALYVRGVYGNTMTANPRALEVASAVLDSMSESLSQNIRARGAELKEKLSALRSDPQIGGVITSVEGTGLLVCAELRSSCPVCGTGGVEERLRKRGIAMIHGGTNGLRFTPHFAITSAEIDLICRTVREVLAESAARNPTPLPI